MAYRSTIDFIISHNERIVTECSTYPKSGPSFETSPLSASRVLSIQSCFFTGAQIIRSFLRTPSSRGCPVLALPGGGKLSLIGAPERFAPPTRPSGGGNGRCSYGGSLRRGSLAERRPIDAPKLANGRDAAGTARSILYRIWRHRKPRGDASVPSRWSVVDGIEFHR